MGTRAVSGSQTRFLAVCDRCGTTAPYTADVKPDGWLKGGLFPMGTAPLYALFCSLDCATANLA